LLVRKSIHIEDPQNQIQIFEHGKGIDITAPNSMTDLGKIDHEASYKIRVFTKDKTYSFEFRCNVRAVVVDRNSAVPMDITREQLKDQTWREKNQDKLLQLRKWRKAKQFFTFLNDVSKPTFRYRELYKHQDTVL